MSCGLPRQSLCDACGLCRTALTVGLEGVGTGKVLVVAAGPSAEEDLSGEPFASRDGRLIRSLMAEAGFEEADYSIVYAVRCHTRAKPTQGEINACRHHLISDVVLRRPSTAIAFGDEAFRALTRRGGLSERRGGDTPLHPEFGYDCLVHPTYGQRYVAGRPQARGVVVADLRRVRDSTRDRDAIAWSWEAEGEQCDPLPTRGQVVAFDIETDYDYATKSGGDTVTQVGWATADGVRVTRSLDRVPDLRAASTVVGHNSWGFDVPRLRDAAVPTPWGEDTLVLAYLDDETQPRSLEALAVKYCGARGWKDEKTAEQGTDAFALYNARDAYWTLRLYEVLRDRLGPRRAIAKEIILPAHLALAACSERGIYINATELGRAGVRYRALLGEAEGRVRDRGVENPRSPADVAGALLAEGHALPVLEKSGKPSTAAGVLAELQHTPLVAAIQEHRKAQKAVSGTIVPYEEIVKTSGRVHPTYSLLKVTGRSSAKDRNVQQLDRELKRIFGAPRGREFTQSDYAAIEFRVAAEVAQETTILERYQQDAAWDAHRWLAARFYGVREEDVSKRQRQVAKSGNFGLLYMATWQTLQAYALKMGVVMTDAEAQALHKLWHETFPAFDDWYGRTAYQLRHEGYVETLTGRRRHYGAPGDVRGAMFAAALREGVNLQVQGLAADIALLGLRACHEKKLPINGFFHDAVSFEFLEGETQRYLPLIEWCLTERPKHYLREHFGVDLKVPLLVETETYAGAA